MGNASPPFTLSVRKCINTFVPGFFFKLSPNRYWAQNHWKAQCEGNIHGCDKYSEGSDYLPVIIPEIQSQAEEHASIMDLGCNCGYCLNELKNAGYDNLSGIEISPNAIEFGKKKFDLGGIAILAGSFENILPDLIRQKKQFDLVYSIGATLELVHPSFDIVGNITKICSDTIVLIIFEWGHAYPRFWEYEFNRNGFMLVKCLRPFDGSSINRDITSIASLMVFKKNKEKSSNRQ